MLAGAGTAGQRIFALRHNSPLLPRRVLSTGRDNLYECRSAGDTFSKVGRIARDERGPYDMVLPLSNHGPGRLEAIMASARIIISRRVLVADTATRAEVVDPERLRLLDGLAYEEMLISEYVTNDELNDLEISGGGIALRFDPETGQLRVVSEFSACRKLRKAELQALVAETKGQWSDGIGSDGEGLFPSIDPTLDLDFCSGDADLRVEQVAETKQRRPRRTLARAAQKGDIEAIRGALDAGENIDSELGGVAALCLAIMAGHPDAAILLIEKGANLGVPPAGGRSPLVACAGSLPEADAIRVSATILARGGNSEISLAYVAASSKWKMELAQFLVQHGADPHHREKQTQQDIECRRLEEMRRARRRRN